MKKYAFLLCLLFPFSGVSSAEVDGFGVFAADFGGDALVDVSYTDGTKADIDAGRGIVIGGGANISIMPDVSLQAIGSWKFTTVPQASNGDVTWTRIPIDLLGFYQMNKFKAGLGISYQLSNKLKGTGTASQIGDDFENALGYVAAIEYLMTSKLALTARYTIISYESPKYVSANGNSIGAGINWYFTKK